MRISQGLMCLIQKSNIFGQNLFDLKKVYCVSLRKRKFLHVEYEFDEFFLLADVDRRIVDVTRFMYNLLLGNWVSYPIPYVSMFGFYHFGENHLYFDGSGFCYIADRKKEAIDELKKCLGMVGVECEEVQIDLREIIAMDADVIYILPFVGNPPPDFPFCLEHLLWYGVFVLMPEGVKLIKVTAFCGDKGWLWVQYECFNQNQLYSYLSQGCKDERWISLREEIIRGFVERYQKECRLISDAYVIRDGLKEEIYRRTKEEGLI